MESCNEVVTKWLKSQFDNLRDQYKDKMYSRSDNTHNIIKDMISSLGGKMEEIKQNLMQQENLNHVNMKLKERIFDSQKYEKECEILYIFCSGLEDEINNGNQNKYTEIHSLQDELREAKNCLLEERNESSNRIRELLHESQKLSTEMAAMEDRTKLVDERNKLEMVNVETRVNQKNYNLEEKNIQLEETIKKLKEDLDNTSKQLLIKGQEANTSQSIVEQEVTLLKSRNESFLEREQKFKAEIEQLKNQNKNYSEQVNNLKDHNIKLEQDDTKVTQCKDEIEGLRAKNRLIENEKSEIRCEKQYLDGQLIFYKQQMEENKKMHEALINALSNQIKHEDDNDVIEKNTKLRAELGTTEGKLRLLQEKLGRYKQFKKMIKSTSTVQCKDCTKIISTQVFLQHMSVCSQNSMTSRMYMNADGWSTTPNHNSKSNIANKQNQDMNRNSFYRDTSSQNILHNLNPVNNQNAELDVSHNGYTNQNNASMFSANSNTTNALSHFTVNINQTVVKENPENNKPYIDYVIEVIKGSNFRWKLTRKYKEFCELHHDLVSAYSGVMFPESAGRILGFNVDFTSLLRSRRPTVIEDRRRDLQQYIRDLQKMPQINNSPLIKKFLKIEEHFDDYGIKKTGFINTNDDMSQNNMVTATKNANYFINQETEPEEPSNFQKNLPPPSNNKNFYQGNILNNQQVPKIIDLDSNEGVNSNNHKDQAESFHSQSSYSNYSKNNKVNEINARVNGFQAKDFNRAINYEQAYNQQEKQSQSNQNANCMNQSKSIERSFPNLHNTNNMYQQHREGEPINEQFNLQNLNNSSDVTKNKENILTNNTMTQMFASNVRKDSDRNNGAFGNFLVNVQGQEVPYNQNSRSRLNNDKMQNISSNTNPQTYTTNSRNLSHNNASSTSRTRVNNNRQGGLYH